MPGRTRVAAVIDWLRVGTSVFFLLWGRGEILLTARSGIYEQKRLISIINRFVRSGGSWSRGARYSEGAGARCDARADLGFETTPKNH